MRAQRPPAGAGSFDAASRSSIACINAANAMSAFSANAEVSATSGSGQSVANDPKAPLSASVPWWQ
jgi:hypothetical protein